MTGLPRLTVTAAIAVLLTALSLQPTLQDARWLIPTLVCVSLVAGTGYLARRLRVPRLLVPLIELVVLGALLVLRFTQDVAVWGFLPGRDVLLEARFLLDEAVSTIASYTAPAPVTPGLAFLLALSVAVVAVVVDTVAVTYRSPALAGLPLLVLYAVPVSVVANGVSWIYFGVAAAGWLALLLADGRERLGGWGRRLGTRTFAGDPTANDVPVVAEPLGTVGRRIGVAAVGLAVVIPALVPGLSEAIFGRGSGSGTGSGGGIVNTINPYVSLASDLNRPLDSEVLTYLTTTATPDYLRVVTLDTFDGSNWLPASLQTSGRITDGTLPTPPGLSATTPRTEVTTQIQTTELTQSTWLPAPYPVTAVTVEGNSARDWVWDTSNRVIWSPRGDTEDLRYTVQSLLVEPTRSQLTNPGPLDPTFLGTYTKLPLTISATVRETASEVTAGAVGAINKAVALQDWFRSDLFVYDTSTTPTTNDPLTGFLTSRRGFCQQFAGTFAVMARSLGLPTRVVVGFVPGERTQLGVWQVTWHDTHAWPEVYFEGTGWVRFEPTKRSDPAGISVPAWTVPQGEDIGGEKPDPGITASPGSGNSASPGSSAGGIAPEERPRGEGGAAGEQQGGFPWVWVLVPLAVITLLLLPWAVRIGQRRRRLAQAGGPEPRPAAAAAWSELAATCADLDLAWPASRTPRQVAAALIDSAALEPIGDLSVAAPAADALRRLAMATERARYSRAPEPVLGLNDDVVSAITGLLASVSRAQRVRAALAPVSLLTRVGDKTADTLDWVDAAPRRAGRVLRPRRPRRTRRPTAVDAKAPTTSKP